MYKIPSHKTGFFFKSIMDSTTFALKIYANDLNIFHMPIETLSVQFRREKYRSVSFFDIIYFAKVCSFYKKKLTAIKFTKHYTSLILFIQVLETLKFERFVFDTFLSTLFYLSQTTLDLLTPLLSA